MKLNLTPEETLNTVTTSEEEDCLGICMTTKKCRSFNVLKLKDEVSCSFTWQTRYNSTILVNTNAYNLFEVYIPENCFQ